MDGTAAWIPSSTDTAEPVTAWARQLPSGASLSAARGPITAIVFAALSRGSRPPSFLRSTIDLRATSRAAATWAGFPSACFSRAASE